MPSKYLFFILSISYLCACKQEPTSPLPVAEKWRPTYHFTPDSMWMNDPNGLVYADGIYHLFYQFYPDSNVWGPMHWGHATSKDLVSWEHQPIALYPDSLGYIFSGSAVVDTGNTAGFGKNAMVAMFTHHNDKMEKAGSNVFQYQSLAYSTDGGKTFVKYAGNPVVKNPSIRDFRDPKVSWYAPGQHWVMVLAAYDRAKFYTSPDLKIWTEGGEFGLPGDDRLWECPDLVRLKVEGTEEYKWVLITSIQKKAPNGGTGTSYFVGDFDGKTFKGDIKNQKWADYGTDNYAMVTWGNTPGTRTLALGWMSNWLYAQNVPTTRWRSTMTVPRELALVKGGNDYSLVSKPAAELKALEKSKIESKDPQGKVLEDANLSQSKIVASFTPAQEDVVFSLSNTKGEHLDFGYEAKTRRWFIDRSHAGLSNFYQGFAACHYCPEMPPSAPQNFEAYIDATSIELFINGGKVVMTDIFFPTEAYTHFERKGGGEMPVEVIGFGR
ncbi:MAG TPA: glycoside hydrolase family 32 protein [Saprospiraceae bacterium]|nr:glycoside hydrolase family 32 protein [Saprospiraceae bacterium]